MKYLILIIFLSTACGTLSTSSITSLKVGMRKAEVTNIMGKPDITNAKGNIEVLRYHPETCLRTPFKGNTEYVRIINGKVESFGLFDEMNLQNKGNK